MSYIKFNGIQDSPSKSYPNKVKNADYITAKRSYIDARTKGLENISDFALISGLFSGSASLRRIGDISVRRHRRHMTGSEKFAMGALGVSLAALVAKWGKALFVSQEYDKEYQSNKETIA